MDADVFLTFTQKNILIMIIMTMIVQKIMLIAFTTAVYMILHIL